MRIHSNFLDKFMEYSAFAQAPEKFLKWSALSVIAGALERKVWLSNGAATFYPNLYVMLIGDAGTRKSSSAHLAVEILREVQGIRFIAPRINEASFMHALLLAGEKKFFEYQGEKYKHSAGYLYASEAATTFTAMYQGGGVVIPLTDVFNCEPLGWSHDQGWAKHTLKDGIINVFNPCVNMLACSTPAWFTNTVMTRLDAEAGFGSRLLIVVQKERLQRAFGWTETTATNHKLKMELVNDLRHINKLQGPFSIDSTFRVAYARLDERLNKHLLSEVISPLMTGYYERKLTHSTKLAMCLSASKKDELLLTADDLYEAWDLVTTLEEQMTKAYSALEPERVVENVGAEIIAHLKSINKSRFTRGYLVTKFKLKYPVKDIFKAVDQMIRAHTIKYVLTGEGLKEPTFDLVSLSSANQQDASHISETQPSLRQ